MPKDEILRFSCTSIRQKYRERVRLRRIARGIRYFDTAGVDIIIIGRGGGSIEDLWAFNEIEVADAIYYADTPIISGTGHEIDMTIA